MPAEPHSPPFTPQALPQADADDEGDANDGQPAPADPADGEYRYFSNNLRFTHILLLNSGLLGRRACSSHSVSRPHPRHPLFLLGALLGERATGQGVSYMLVSTVFLSFLSMSSLCCCMPVRATGPAVLLPMFRRFGGT